MTLDDALRRLRNACATKKGSVCERRARERRAEPFVRDIVQHILSLIGNPNGGLFTHTYTHRCVHALTIRSRCARSRLAAARASVLD